MRKTYTREQILQEDSLKGYAISEEKLKKIQAKGMYDLYVYDDLAKKNPMTIRFKKRRPL